MSDLSPHQSQKALSFTWRAHVGPPAGKPVACRFTQKAWLNASIFFDPLFSSESTTVGFSPEISLSSAA